MTSWYEEMFAQSSIPMLLLDVTVLREKCKDIQRNSWKDLDKYLYEEFSLKRYLVSFFRIIAINQAFLDLFGIEKMSDIGTKESLLVDSVYDRIKQIIVNEIFYEKIDIVYEYSSNNLPPRDSVLKIYVNFFENNEKYLSTVSIIDVSSYKKSEFILTEFVEKYYLLFKSIKDAIFIIDLAAGHILEFNDKASDLLKIPPEDIVGKNLSSFVCQEHRPKYEFFLNKKIYGEGNGDETITLFIVVSNGDCLPVQVGVTIAVVGNVQVAQVVLHDMSNRFKMEEGRRLLATAVEQAAESVIITDIYGNIQYVNPACEDVSGYSFTEMLGKNPRMLQSGETPSYQYKLLWEEITKGNVWRGMFINRRKNGEVYQEEATITPVKDNNDKIISYVAVKRDITQHLLLENQIRQSQKMQAIGTLAGGVAHDFNNILTAIMGYAELSQSQCDRDSLVYNNLVEIIRGADRAGKLVDQILKFSRQSEKNVSNLQLGLIVKEAIRLLRASLPANIELVCECQEDFFVKADPTQMHQIVMNLCTNAYQALEGKGGVIRLRLFRKMLSPQEGVITGNLPQGAYVCLQVEDNGTGIAPEYLQRIFEPYFTTKNLHEGTGLGLSVVHGIVNDHRGAVTVESTPGQGSCFTVFLPEAKEDAGKNVSPETDAPAVFEGTILVVDDEQPITFFLVQVLEHLGYKVEACLSSDDAFNTFLERQDAFDLIITDMGMPGMTGLELAEKIKTMNADIPIMLCTGYSEHVTAENYQQMGLAGFVAKPFNAEHLAREVARIIGEARGARAAHRHRETAGRPAGAGQGGGA
ncbi:hybrid sensor histidine kinase/response regulator [Desulfobulbus elongatus]|uniref:hybrid sensor histidine kinase/response regulator n=1 Tax=Desulfobulbus elongatus TaxID=53332 RepID=UPI00146FC800|nr:PAS domain S-box protein [Desulfobulbus elongatus]